MRTSIEELIRRLVLLGMPLTIGCGSSLGGTPGPGPGPGPGGCQSTHSFDQVLSVARPTQNPDSGYGATIADWDACAETMQCTPLCYDIAPTFKPIAFAKCEVVGDAGVPVEDAGDGARMEPGLQVHLAYTYTDCTGRRPARFAPRPRCAQGSAVGRWFADAAVLEAASVPAFRQLARELEAHRAPAALVRAARRAVRDEVRHFRLTEAVARANGATVRPARTRRVPVRPLLEIAAENAREGCVRETFGAATAAYQARYAADPQLRAVMSAIAADEARHAQLAWEVDAWTRDALPSRARRIVDERRAAARVLQAEIAASAAPDAALARALGLPTGRALRTLADQARALLWDAVA